MYKEKKCIVCRYWHRLPNYIENENAICLNPHKNIEPIKYSDSCNFWEQNEDHPIDSIVKANEALTLYNNTPNDSVITDADTILKDFMDKSDFEITGLGKDILNEYLNCYDKVGFKNLFELFTSIPFMEYLDKCIKNTTQS